MILVKIAAGNALRHRLSSAILVLVFTIGVFVTIWAFGFGSAVSEFLINILRDSYGDIILVTDYQEETTVRDLLKSLQVKKILLEREIFCMLDSSKKSSVVTITELTEENRVRMKEYFRPITGTIPDKEDEILVPELIWGNLYQVGDSIFITTSTADGVVNALKYRIVGFNKISGIKGMATSGLGCMMVTRESMNTLLNTTTRHNLIYIYADEELRSREFLEPIHEKAKALLEQGGVKIKKSWTIHKELDRWQALMKLLPVLYFLVLIIVFPVVGSVVLAVIWLYSFKRRKEIWTYIALGMRNGAVYRVMAMEYIILCVVGTATGIGLAFASFKVVMINNVWLRFGYLLSTPLIAKVDAADVALVAVFMLASVVLWSLPPLRRIINAPPFSF